MCEQSIAAPAEDTEAKQVVECNRKASVIALLEYNNGSTQEQREPKSDRKTDKMQVHARL